MAKILSKEFAERIGKHGSPKKTRVYVILRGSVAIFRPNNPTVLIDLRESLSNMTDEGKTIVLKANHTTIDADALFRDPEALKKHMDLVASLDANQDQHNPDKPATRVSSLDSFLTNSKRTSLSLKSSENGSNGTAVSEANVKAFARPETSQSRKK